MRQMAHSGETIDIGRALVEKAGQRLPGIGMRVSRAPVSWCAGITVGKDMDDLVIRIDDLGADVKRAFEKIINAAGLWPFSAQGERPAAEIAEIGKSGTNAVAVVYSGTPVWIFPVQSAGYRRGLEPLFAVLGNGEGGQPKAGQNCEHQDVN